MKLNQEGNEIKNKEFSEDLKAMAAIPDVVRRICLPVDVVQEEILTRLPVKHLLRCKLLSREYNSLIKNPSFIKRHLLRQQSSPTNNKIVVVGVIDGKTPDGILSVLSSSSSPDVVYVPDPARSDRLSLVGSCNGLLCVWFQPPGYSKLRLMLRNPATRNQLILPDLENSPEAVGFGYDAASGDYKLVTFSSNYSHLHRRVNLWTMSSNCWKDVSDALVGFKMDIVFPHGMLLPHANKLYWQCTGSKYDTHALLSFDMTDETFQPITLPSDITSADVYFDLIHNMGSLALSVLHLNYEGIHFFDIWVMDDNNNNGCWTKRFSNINVPDSSYQLRFSISSDMLMLESFDKLNYFILYDPHSKEEKQNCPCPGGYQIPNQPWSYIESLVNFSWNDFTVI